jgi:Druantia protein DruA
MFVSQMVQGRWLSAEEVEVIRRLIAEHPHWSRRRLSVAVSEAFNWRTASGQLKDMSARLLLAKLAQRGFVELPPRQRRGGRRRLRVLCQSDWTAGREQILIEGPLEFLRPLEVVLVKPRAPEETDFVCYLAYYHYLGFDGASGQNLRYLIRDCYRRELACVLFGCAAWKVKARDRFIGWNIEQRQRRLGLIANNSRFLILPHVRVPHLASHILGLILRRLRADWQRKYQLAPCLAETFIEHDRFSGTCYRAANWLLVGQTCGRTRYDRYNTVRVPIKDIYLYPLCADFKEQLCK